MANSKPKINRSAPRPDQLRDAALCVSENLSDTFWMPKPIPGSDQVSEEKPEQIVQTSTADAPGSGNVSIIYMPNGAVFQVTVQLVKPGKAS